MPDNDAAFFGRSEDRPADNTTVEVGPWQWGDRMSDIPLVQDDRESSPPWLNSHTIGVSILRPLTEPATDFISAPIRVQTALIYELWTNHSLEALSPDRFIVTSTAGVTLFAGLDLSYGTVFDVGDPQFRDIADEQRMQEMRRMAERPYRVRVSGLRSLREIEIGRADFQRALDSGALIPNDFGFRVAHDILINYPGRVEAIHAGDDLEILVTPTWDEVVADPPYARTDPNPVRGRQALGMVHDEPGFFQREDATLGIMLEAATRAGLTARQFELLRVLVQHPERLVRPDPNALRRLAEEHGGLLDSERATGVITQPPERRTIWQRIGDDPLIP